jgi:hypothetical protein
MFFCHGDDDDLFFFFLAFFQWKGGSLRSQLSRKLQGARKWAFFAQTTTTQWQWQWQW